MSLFLFMILYFGNGKVIRNSIKNRNNRASKELKIESNDSDKGEIGITKTEVRAKLIKLNLAPFVVELFDETKSLEDFCDTFSPPHHIFFFTKKEQEPFEVDRYIPLFETMDDFLEVLAYDTHQKGFIIYCPEEDIPEVDALSWDEVFVMQILTWYEDEKTDTEILEVCKLLGLKYGSEVIESIKKELGTKYSWEDITSWENNCCEMIRKKLSTKIQNK